MVDIQTVSVLVADEVLEDAILDVAVTTVGLDHHLLVRVLSVDVGISDGRDSRPRAKRTDGTSSTPIAVNVLNEQVGGGVLDGDALVLVGNFDVVDMDVASPNIDAVKTTPVGTTDDEIVNLRNF